MNYSKGGKDSCNGDSGGALVCDINGKATLLATVSWGYKCALDGYPGVYVQIDKYYDWIETGKNSLILIFQIHLCFSYDKL